MICDVCAEETWIRDVLWACPMHSKHEWTRLNHTLYALWWAGNSCKNEEIKDHLQHLVLKVEEDITERARLGVRSSARDRYQMRETSNFCHLYSTSGASGSKFTSCAQVNYNVQKEEKLGMKLVATPTQAWMERKKLEIFADKKKQAIREAEQALKSRRGYREET